MSADLNRIATNAVVRIVALIYLVGTLGYAWATATYHWRLVATVFDKAMLGLWTTTSVLGALMLIVYTLIRRRGVWNHTPPGRIIGRLACLAALAMTMRLGLWLADVSSRHFAGTPDAIAFLAAIFLVSASVPLILIWYTLENHA